MKFRVKKTKYPYFARLKDYARNVARDESLYYIVGPDKGFVLGISLQVVDVKEDALEAIPAGQEITLCL